MLDKFRVASAAMLAILLGSGALVACTYGPAETHQRVQNAALNADGTRVAVMVKIESYRPATGLAAFPDGGVPKMLLQEAHLYVVDVVSPAVEQRIPVTAPRQHRNSFNPWLIGWDGDSVYMQIPGCAGEPGDECWGPLVTRTVLRLQPGGDLAPTSDVPRLRLASRAEGPNGYIEVHKEGYGVSVATRQGGSRVPLLEFEGTELRLRQPPQATNPDRATRRKKKEEICARGQSSLRV